MDEEELAKKFHILWHLLGSNLWRSTPHERSTAIGVETVAHRLEHDPRRLQVSPLSELLYISYYVKAVIRSSIY